MERADKEFGEIFIKNTTTNPTPQMHSLFARCDYSYGLVGLLTKESLKVIHAMYSTYINKGLYDCPNIF
jgi:hypothetical protein